jgi:hypothetical protein
MRDGKKMKNEGSAEKKSSGGIELAMPTNEMRI